MSRKTYVVAVAIVEFRGRFLIAKRAATKKFAPGQWEFISGFIDTKESAEEIILRELKEEVSLDGEVINTTNPFCTEDEEGRWVILPFKVAASNDDADAKSEDHSELKWVVREELAQYPDLKDFLDKREIQTLLNHQ